MLYMDTETNKKSYPEVKTFLDSIGQQFKTFDLKRETGAIPSQTVFNRISKQNEMKEKREQLKQLIMMIERETGIYTLNVESLLRELLKQDRVSLYAFLDQKVSEKLS